MESSFHMLLFFFAVGCCLIKSFKHFQSLVWIQPMYSKHHSLNSNMESNVKELVFRGLWEESCSPMDCVLVVRHKRCRDINTHTISMFIDIPFREIHHSFISVTHSWRFRWKTAQGDSWSSKSSLNLMCLCMCVKKASGYMYVIDEHVTRTSVSVSWRVSHGILLDCLEVGSWVWMLCNRSYCDGPLLGYIPSFFW